MPTYTYEAMDQTTGDEVKDTIEATCEAEAQAMVRQKGFFVTKTAERGRDKKGKKKDKDKTKGRATGKKRKTFAIGGVSAKKLCTFTRQLSTLQDAGLPILRSLRILDGQAKPGALKNPLFGGSDDHGGGNKLS